MSADAVTHLSQGATMLHPQSVGEDDGQCGPLVLKSGTRAPVLPCFAQVESTKAKDPMEKTTFSKVSCLTSNTTDFTLFSETLSLCSLGGPGPNFAAQTDLHSVSHFIFPRARTGGIHHIPG